MEDAGSPNGRAGMEYLGDDPAPYQRLYEVKPDDEQKAWAYLINTPESFRDCPAPHRGDRASYLFLGIALGLIMAVSGAGPLGLALTGTIVLVFTQILEGGLLVKRELRQEIVYDQIDLIHTSRRAELLNDLQERTGLDLHRVEVEDIDLIKIRRSWWSILTGPRWRAAGRGGSRPPREVVGNGSLAATRE